MIIGIVVVLVLLAGFYYWYSSQSKPEVEPDVVEPEVEYEVEPDVVEPDVVETPIASEVSEEEKVLLNATPSEVVDAPSDPVVAEPVSELSETTELYTITNQGTPCNNKDSWILQNEKVKSLAFPTLQCPNQMHMTGIKAVQCPEGGMKWSMTCSNDSGSDLATVHSNCSYVDADISSQVVAMTAVQPKCPAGTSVNGMSFWANTADDRKGISYRCCNSEGKCGVIRNKGSPVPFIKSINANFPRCGVKTRMAGVGLRNCGTKEQPGMSLMGKCLVPK